MLVNPRRIHCAFALFKRKSSRSKFFDLKNLCFRGDFGAEDEGRLTPFEDDKAKESENTGFQAGLDNYCQANIAIYILS